MLILALKWCAFVCGDDLVWEHHVSLCKCDSFQGGGKGGQKKDLKFKVLKSI